MLAVVPTDACIGNTLAVIQLGRIVFARRELLRAIQQMALDHHTKHLVRTAGHLRSNVLGHLDLAGVQFAAVGVAAIDHQGGR